MHAVKSVFYLLMTTALLSMVTAPTQALPFVVILTMAGITVFTHIKPRKLPIVHVSMIAMLLMATPALAAVWTDETITGTSTVTGFSDIDIVDNQTWITCFTHTPGAGTKMRVWYSESNDGGSTWTNRSMFTSTAGEIPACGIIAASETDYYLFFTNVTVANTITVRKSTNAGDTWTGTNINVAVASPAIQEVTATSDQQIGFTFRATTGTQFARTENAGSTWATSGVIGGSSDFTDSFILVESEDTLRISGTTTTPTPDSVRVYESTDFGATWNIVATMPQTGTNVLGSCATNIPATPIFIAYPEDNPAKLNFRWTSTDGAWWYNERTIDSNLGNVAGMGCTILHGSDSITIIYPNATSGMWRAASMSLIGLDNTTLISAWSHTNISPINAQHVGRDIHGDFADGFDVAIHAGSVIVSHTPVPTAPDGSFPLDDPRDVRVNHDNEARIYTRSFGDNRAHRLNATLSLINAVTGCPETGPADTTYGMALTIDSQPIIACDAQSAFLGWHRLTNTLSHQNTVLEVTDDSILDAWTGNVFAHFGRSVSNTIITVWNQPEGDTTCQRTEGPGAFDGGDIDDWTGKNMSTADITLGIFVISTTDCSLVSESQATAARATAINNNTLWSAGNYGIRRHGYIGGITTQATQATTVPTSNALRLSKDAEYLIAWEINTGEVWLLNSTGTMDVITTLIVPNVRSCDMDVNNNRIYCIDDESVMFFNVFDVTFGFGQSDSPGTPHNLEGDPFDGIDTTSPSTTTPTEPNEILQFQGLQDLFGVNLQAALGFVGFIIALFIMWMTWAVTENVVITVIVGFGTILMLVFIEFIPQWVVALLALVIIGFIVLRMRG